MHEGLAGRRGPRETSLPFAALQLVMCEKLKSRCMCFLCACAVRRVDCMEVCVACTSSKTDSSTWTTGGLVRYTPVCAASCDSAVWIESNRTWRLY